MYMYLFALTEDGAHRNMIKWDFLLSFQQELSIFIPGDNCLVRVEHIFRKALVRILCLLSD
jgi:hypothetical protein